MTDVYDRLANRKSEDRFSVHLEVIRIRVLEVLERRPREEDRKRGESAGGKRYGYAWVTCSDSIGSSFARVGCSKFLWSYTYVRFYIFFLLLLIDFDENTFQKKEGEKLLLRCKFSFDFIISIVLCLLWWYSWCFLLI